jgi:MscS family membrane protein
MVAVLDFVLSKKYDVVFSGFDDLLINIIRKTLKVIIVIMSILFIGQNILGLNITAILAGAGVAGLAVAFAAQDSIANFFGSIMIAVDKPFKVGDEIITDGVNGVVENLGFRSIWIRTPNGHMVTIPNKIAANTKIENVTKKPYVKFVHDLTLAYGTKPDKLEQAMKILNEIYANHPGLTPSFPPRIYFNKFQDSALNINITIWMYSVNAFAAQEWNSNANIEILKRFNETEIDFASPALLEYLNKTKKT